MPQTFTVPSSAVYRSADGSKSYQYYTGDVVPMELAVELQMTGAYFVPDVAPTANNRNTATFAATATATGATTGTIPEGVDAVIVTSADANNIVILPDAPLMTRLLIQVGANGCEIRSHAPATVGINGGTGAAAESAVGANLTVEVVRTTATNWVGSTKTATGVVAVLQVAAP